MVVKDVSGRDVIVGNVYDKYGTRNPVARALMSGFLRAVVDLYRAAAPRTVLEIGTGEGLLAQRLVTAGPRPARFVATDLHLGRIAPGLDPLIEFREANVNHLPFSPRSFDLVVCCEVLEHLQDPRHGLAELARVASGAVLLSTPREPLWRLLNLARGKYVRDLGNTPGHVQHFSRRKLVELAGAFLALRAERNPIPWTVLLGAPIR